MQIINATDGIRITNTQSTASLLSKVLWITTAGFLFTALGAYLAPEIFNGLSFGFVAILSFGLLFATMFAARRSTALGLTLFYIFAMVEGVVIGPMIKAYLHMPNGQAVVFDAALTTAVGMAVMGMIAQIVNFNYQKVANYAVAALFALIIVGVLASFFHFLGPVAYSAYSWIGLAIFSVLLLVDFMRLRDTPAGASPVMLSLSIYLDALNIFLFLLQIFGNGGGRRNSKWS